MPCLARDAQRTASVPPVLNLRLCPWAHLAGVYATDVRQGVGGQHCPVRRWVARPAGRGTGLRARSGHPLGRPRAAPRKPPRDPLGIRERPRAPPPSPATREGTSRPQTEHARAAGGGGGRRRRGGGRPPQAGGRRARRRLARRGPGRGAGSGAGGRPRPGGGGSVARAPRRAELAGASAAVPRPPPQWWLQAPAPCPASPPGPARGAARRPRPGSCCAERGQLRSSITIATASAPRRRRRRGQQLSLLLQAASPRAPETQLAGARTPRSAHRSCGERGGRETARPGAEGSPAAGDR